MRVQQCICATILSIFLMGGWAVAKDAPVLFKDFTYGMTRAEVQKLTNASKIDEPGTEDLLFAPETVKFANFDWVEAFRFDSRNQLTQVLLIREEFSNDAYLSLVKGIASNGYGIAYMTDGANSFDLVSKWQEYKSAEKVNAAANRFELETLQNDKPLTLLLAPTDYLRKLISSNRAESFMGSLLTAPASLRVVEIDIEDGSLAAAFTTPVAVRQEMIGSVKDIREKF